MSLRELAESDLAITLEDPAGFGWAITLINPAGTAASLRGQSTDISQIIDPDTGQVVSGRLAAVTIRVASLAAAGLTLPQGIAGAESKPWLVGFDDINGQAYTFKVAESNPDRALGVVTCLLEAYNG